jgi:hypothetical protein
MVVLKTGEIRNGVNKETEGQQRTGCKRFKESSEEGIQTSGERLLLGDELVAYME